MHFIFDFYYKYFLLLAYEIHQKTSIKFGEFRELTTSDGSGLGLSPKPARPRRFLGGPSPPEARSSKPESPAGFFGPKIGRFSANFWPNLGKIMAFFITKKFSICFWPEIGQNRPILGQFPAEFVA